MSSSGNIPEVAEERVTISGPDVNLEGRLAMGDGVSGVVITHPHPLYGGTMDNNVVWTAVRAFQARHWSTLRFNFRGVGLSSGEYGDGIAEMADVQAALSFLRSRQSGPPLSGGLFLRRRGGWTGHGPGSRGCRHDYDRPPYSHAGNGFSPQGASSAPHCGGGPGRILPTAATGKDVRGSTGRSASGNQSDKKFQPFFCGTGKACIIFYWSIHFNTKFFSKLAFFIISAEFTSPFAKMAGEFDFFVLNQRLAVRGCLRDYLKPLILHHDPNPKSIFLL